MLKTRLLRRGASGVLAVGLAVGLAAVTTPAMAATDFGTPSPTNHKFAEGNVANYIYWPDSDGHFTGDCQYRGGFLDTSRIDEVDWTNDGTIDECFGVAPDHTIWHAWRNSGGWHEMPRGSADDVFAAYRQDGYRKFSVLLDYVRAGDDYWNAVYGSGGWTGWYRGGPPS